MEQAIRNLQRKPEHIVEVVVYVSETLEEVRRGDLVSELEQDESIVAAEFCPLRYHLMLVRYDRDAYTSQDVLNRVRLQNIHARLIGPV